MFRKKSEPMSDALLEIIREDARNLRRTGPFFRAPERRMKKEKGMRQTIEDCGNGWFRPGVSLEIAAFRTGWRGAWDAFKAALFRDPRMQVPATITFSMYVKRPPDDFVLWGAQLENWNEKEV